VRIRRRPSSADVPILAHHACSRLGALEWQFDTQFPGSADFGAFASSTRPLCDIVNSTESRWRFAVEKFIARENIRRFEVQLLTSADERQKAVIRELLTAERLA